MTYAVSECDGAIGSPVQFSDLAANRDLTVAISAADGRTKSEHSAGGMVIVSCISCWFGCESCTKLLNSISSNCSM